MYQLWRGVLVSQEPGQGRHPPQVTTEGGEQSEGGRGGGVLGVEAREEAVCQLAEERLGLGGRSVQGDRRGYNCW